MPQPIERIYKLEVDATQATRQLKAINRNTKSIAGGFSAVGRAAGAAFSIIGAVKGLAGLTRASDQVELLEGSFQALLGTGDRASDMMERVFRTVQETGAGLDDTSSAFQRLSIGLREIGGSNAQIDQVANTFIKLGRVSGTSMFETNAALVQFSQGLASGKLQGDELRSIMERLPLITELIADEYSRVNDNIKVTRGEVKQLGREGKITSEIMANALLNASTEVAAQFELLVFTMDQELNALKGTATILLAELSSATGIGDGIKAGIGAANEALSAFTRNLKPFLNDMETLWKSSEAIRTTFKSLAFMITALLIPSIYKAATAMRVFVASNPILALAAVTTIAVLAIIKNWDRLRPFFLYQVPSWFKALEAKWYEFADFMVMTGKNMWRDIKEYFVEGFNDVLGTYNTAVAIVRATAGINLPFFDTLEVVKQGDAVKQWGEETTEALVAAMLLQEDYDLALAATGKTAAKAADELKLFNSHTGPSAEALEAMIKRDKELTKFAETVKNTADPLREMNQKLEDAMLLLSRGLIDEAQYLSYKAAITGVTEEAEKLAEAAKENALYWEEFIHAIDVALDPFKALEDQIRMVEMALEQGLDPVKGAAYINMLIDKFEQGGDAANNLSADMTKAGVSFIESFSTGLADALVEGELNFSEFATALLKDLARLILRAVLFNAIIGGIDAAFGTSFGAPSTGGAGGLGVQAQAAGGGSDHNVGILTPPVYGRNAYKQAGGVNVTVNNNASTDVTVSQNTTGSGVDIDILIERKVNQSIASGGLDKALKSSFGLGRRGY